MLIIISENGTSSLIFASQKDLKENQTYKVKTTVTLWIRAIESNVEGEEEISIYVILFHPGHQTSILDLTYDRDSDQWSEPIETQINLGPK